MIKKKSSSSTDLAYIKKIDMNEVELITSFDNFSI